jgi:hypothetical protein
MEKLIGVEKFESRLYTYYFSSTQLISENTSF